VQYLPAYEVEDTKTKSAGILDQNTDYLAATWRGHSLSPESLVEARNAFATSVGVCHDTELSTGGNERDNTMAGPS
jgi:hypothetical protein